jgi:putative peptidoglycan lipid II flippase
MIGLAFPLVDLIFRGGLFHRESAHEMALYFAIFSISLCFWCAQILYARAFYAAGNTLAPMIAGTIVVLVSLPIYWSLYRAKGAIGLAAASDAGIVIQTATLGVLLHRRKMVALSGLEFKELGRSAFAALAAFGAIYLVTRAMPAARGGRWNDLLLLLVATAAWLAVSAAILQLTGSDLPRQLIARFRKSPVASIDSAL